MRRKHDLSAIGIRLTGGGEKLLFVLLHKDGSINRRGDGILGKRDGALYIGVTDRRLFEDLRDRVDDEWLGQSLQFDMPEPAGAACELDLHFFFGDETTRLLFRYGADSEGPPGYIGDFVRAAVRISDEWYLKARRRKGWWRFW